MKDKVTKHFINRRCFIHVFYTQWDFSQPLPTTAGCKTGSSYLSNLWFTSCSAILYVHQTIPWQDSFHEDKHFFSWKKTFLFVKINISFHENNSPHCKSRSQQHACKWHGRRMTVCQKTYHCYHVRHQNCGNTSIFPFHHTNPYRSKCTRWKQKKHINWTNVNLSSLLIKSR